MAIQVMYIIQRNYNKYKKLNNKIIIIDDKNKICLL